MFEVMNFLDARLRHNNSACRRTSSLYRRQAFRSDVVWARVVFADVCVCYEHGCIVLRTRVVPADACATNTGSTGDGARVHPPDPAQP
eukprot:630167-Rhodomonas_salina.1